MIREKQVAIHFPGTLGMTSILSLFCSIEDDVPRVTYFFVRRFGICCILSRKTVGTMIGQLNSNQEHPTDRNNRSCSGRS